MSLCINQNLDPTPTLPSFIGNGYFCDTAFETAWSSVPNYESIQVSNPLWDGEGCGPMRTPAHVAMIQKGKFIPHGL